MELGQMSCCGIFELMDIGDDYNWTDSEEHYNSETGEYETITRSRSQALADCKRAIQEELKGVQPRGRLVLATTVGGMSIPQAALRSLRFRVDRRFRNGNTGNRVTLWAKYIR